MNGIKAQYILAISLLFGVALYSFYGADKEEVQESYKEIPKDYLQRDRGIAQAGDTKVINSVVVVKDRNLHLHVNEKVNANEIKDKDLIERFSFDKDLSTGNISFVKNYKAILKTEDNLAQYPDAPVKGSFILISSDEPVDNAKSLVVNETEKEIGVFFDVVKVKLNNDDSSKLFNNLSSYSYEVIENYSHLNLFVIKFSNSEETINAYELLKEKAIAKRLSLEIKYYFRAYR